MTTQSADTALRGLTRPLRAGRAIPFVLNAAGPLVVIVVFVALAAFTWGAWGDLRHDTGYDFVAADRLAHGDLPYADFPYIYGPLGVGVLAGVFGLLGTSVASAVALGLLLTAAAVALTYALAREVTDATGATVSAALAAAAAFGTGNIGLVLPHATSASAAVVVCLAALLGAARHARTGGFTSLLVAGGAAGSVALTRPEFTAGIAVALASWLALRVWRCSGDARRAELRRAASCTAAAVAVPAVVYGLVLLKVGPGVLRDNLFPSAQLAAGGNAVLETSAPLSVGSFVELTAQFVAYAGGAGVLCLIGIAATRKPHVMTLAVGGGLVVLLATAAVLVVKPEAVRSRLDPAYAWIPAGAALAFLALAWQATKRARTWTASEQAALLVAAFLAVLAAKTYAAFAPQANPDFAQFASYALPFAAVFMAWLHITVLPKAGGPATRQLGILWLCALALAGAGLVAHDGILERGTVRGPGGKVAMPGSQAPAYQAAVDAIIRSTRRGEPILLAPQLTALYTLTARSNPLPQVSLLPGALATPAQERAAISRLAEVRTAVIDRRPMTEYGQGAFGTAFDRRLGAYLRGEFRLRATFRGAGAGAVNLEFWQRRTLP